MKALVATRRTQGDEPDDYTWCVDGELLWITEVCARDRRDPEQGCGCGRAFGGLMSHRATTTAEVRLLDIDEQDLRTALRTSLSDQGWLSPVLAPDVQEAILNELVTELCELVEPLPPGTVVRRRLDELRFLRPYG